LLLLGGALLKIAITGDYLRYVKASQQPWLIAAGAVMVVLAVTAIARDIRTAHANAAQAGSDPGADHSHDHGHARSAWLLLLPVLAILLVAPPALGADSVTRAGNRAPAPPADDLVDFPALPATSPVDDTLSDFNARAGWDRAHSLDNRPVRLTGFVVHKGAETYLARLVIACCAADAFPVTVKVTGADVESLPDDTWLQATVVLVPGSSTRANDWTPSATVEALRHIKEPKDAYEY
jgi:uncharacterized repeat protein (TIGR03943 family)